MQHRSADTKYQGLITAGCLLGPNIRVANASAVEGGAAQSAGGQSDTAPPVAAAPILSENKSAAATGGIAPRAANKRFYDATPPRSRASRFLRDLFLFGPTPVPRERPVVSAGAEWRPR
ncbi:unnamed protein product, partial [Iphiclides podalirius]